MARIKEFKYNSSLSKKENDRLRKEFQEQLVKKTAKETTYKLQKELADAAKRKDNDAKSENGESAQAPVPKVTQTQPESTQPTGSVRRSSPRAKKPATKRKLNDEDSNSTSGKPKAVDKKSVRPRKKKVTLPKKSKNKQVPNVARAPAASNDDSSMEDCATSPASLTGNKMSTVARSAAETIEDPTMEDCVASHSSHNELTMTDNKENPRPSEDGTIHSDSTSRPPLVSSPLPINETALSKASRPAAMHYMELLRSMTDKVTQDKDFTKIPRSLNSDFQSEDAVELSVVSLDKVQAEWELVKDVSNQGFDWIRRPHPVNKIYLLTAPAPLETRQLEPPIAAWMTTYSKSKYV
jgi:hypothetical protein